MPQLVVGLDPKAQIKVKIGLRGQQFGKRFMRAAHKVVANNPTRHSHPEVQIHLAISAFCHARPDLYRNLAKTRNQLPQGRQKFGGHEESKFSVFAAKKTEPKATISVASTIP